MGRKKQEAELNAPPSAPETQAAVDALAQAIKDALARAKDSLPDALKGDATVVEYRVNAELAKVNVSAWLTQIVAEGVALIQSGKGPVEHDPSELA